MSAAGSIFAVPMVMAAVVTTSTVARSCGFEDPNSVGAARGILNWAYPNALYVTSAVWQAENSGLLPSRATAKTNALTAYPRTIAALQALSSRISQRASAMVTPPAVSVVLIDKMLWTRFAHGPHGYSAKIHADGPARGDVVIVTEGAVIQALVDASLSAEQARESGLVRFYGDKGNIAQVRDLLRRSDSAAR